MNLESPRPLQRVLPVSRPVPALRRQNATFIKGAVRWADLPQDGRPEVAFIGRSNVGKSSLLNSMVGRRALARTSGTPGKTQQFNYYLIDERMYFVDLPGFGYAKIARTQREKWGRFIGQYLTEREPLRLVFHLVDSRHAPMDLDRDIMGVMRGGRVPYVIVLTKADKLSGNERSKSERRVQDVLADYAMEVPVILTSSKTGRGINELWEWINTVAG